MRIVHRCVGGIHELRAFPHRSSLSDEQMALVGTVSIAHVSHRHLGRAVDVALGGVDLLLHHRRILLFLDVEHFEFRGIVGATCLGTFTLERRLCTVKEKKWACSNSCLVAYRNEVCFRQPLFLCLASRIM